MSRALCPSSRWERKSDDSKSASNSSRSNSSRSVSSKSGTGSFLSGNRSLRSPLQDCSLSNEQGNAKWRSSRSRANKQQNLLPPERPQLGDRFIPSRKFSNLGKAWHAKLDEQEPNTKSSSLAEDSRRRKNKITIDKVCGALGKDERILAFSSKPKEAEGYRNDAKVVYSSHKKGLDASKMRHIPSSCEKVLDAPNLMDDFYLNLLDWSVNNYIAVGLGDTMYLWNASDGGIKELFKMENEHDYICSVKWTEDGQYLAVGDSQNTVQLWDVEKSTCLRNMISHEGRVNALSWNNCIISSGSMDTTIHHHDVRIAEHHTSTLTGHTMEICGIEWDKDGNNIASGGNDNRVHVYDQRHSKPVHVFSEHQAAVKALSWCPWSRGVLATGGGSADRHIRLWNTTTGVCNKAIDTKSQVCALKWSTHYKELLSSHGFQQNQLTIWQYPNMTWTKDLLGHMDRVLYLTLSPDGQTMCSGGADETLRLWKCFEYDEQKEKKKRNKDCIRSTSALFESLR